MSVSDHHPESQPATAPSLVDGHIEVAGRIVGSSNQTFLVEIDNDGERGWAIYKPELGELPLYDFEPGLYRRERAAWALSDHLGWDLVPATVIREDAPFGVGSLQRFIEHDVQQHYFPLHSSCPELHESMRRFALFDVIANNTDRKSGHILLGGDGHLWGIDHGLCFAEDFKLRTVIWDFAGEAIDRADLARIAPLADKVPTELEELLTVQEILALQVRVHVLLETGELPFDPTGSRYPWPLV